MLKERAVISYRLKKLQNPGKKDRGSKKNTFEYPFGSACTGREVRAGKRKKAGQYPEDFIP